MNQIYRLTTDPTIYKEIPLDAEDIADQLNADAHIMDFVYMGIKEKRIAELWGEIATAFQPSPAFPEAIKVPAISVWTGPNLVFSERAYAVFRLMLADYGEFLPIKVSGFTYYLFNNLTDLNPDLSKSFYSNPDIQTVGALEFSNGANQKLLFRSRWEGCTASFCNQKFKDLCEEFELEGLNFSSELIATN
ncbi:hypothetical protein [Microbulbifer sp.]|uniref:hypothetical protein n=1 Tax=Microbulbifer sp. TaxID=1908541 RepID=UPI00258DB892|nr:hypothetical protein [Microbulbifer sp.]